MRHWLVVGAAVGAIILVVFLLGTANSPVAAQAPAQNADVAPPPPPRALEPDPEEIEEDDDIVRIEHFDDLEYDATQELFYLSGNVIFSHQDVKFYCDEAWYNEADDTARATGHLRVVDPEATITGDLAFADFDAEVTTVTGHVTMVTQKKKKEESAAEGEEEEPTKFEEYQQKKTTITCPKLVYEYADDVKRATFFAPIKAVQEDKTAWADSAVYEDLKDIVTLTGNVRVKTKKGEEFRFAEVIISIEEEWMKGKDGSGITFRRRKSEEE